MYVTNPFEVMLVDTVIAHPHVASVASHPCGWCLVVYATNPIEVMLLGIADARSHAASVA